MTATDINHLLERNPDLLADNPLIINPVCNQTLIRTIGNHSCHIHTTDYRTKHFFEKSGSSVTFGLPESINDRDSVIFYWPKSKAFGEALLRWIASCISKPTTLWAIAANDAGGKSLKRPLTAVAEDVCKADMARKCSLWCCTLIPSPDFSWDQTITRFQHEDQEFSTYSGVFNAGKLDVGTRLLLEHLILPEEGKLLDLGCGSGVIGLTCANREPGLTIDMCDIDGMALASSKLNAESLKKKVRVFPSDGLQETARYRVIVSNPPFHQGKNTDYHFSETLFEKAPQHLEPGGELWVVANRHLPYEQWTHHFSSAETISQDSGFKVLRLIR